MNKKEIVAKLFKNKYFWISVVLLALIFMSASYKNQNEEKIDLKASFQENVQDIVKDINKNE